MPSKRNRIQNRRNKLNSRRHCLDRCNRCMRDSDSARLPIPSGDAAASGDDVVQPTKSGGVRSVEPILTDGPRVYYQSIGPLATGWQLRQVLLKGHGDTGCISPGKFYVRGLSPDDSEFVAVSDDAEQSPVWKLPVAGGSPRRVGNLLADDVSWSHDGNWLAYSQGNQLFLAKSDGSSPRHLVTMSDASTDIEYPRWSPDDRKLRFTVASGGPGGSVLDPIKQSLWEVDADGRNLRELRSNWPGSPMECCGDWTADGRYFVYFCLRGALQHLGAAGNRTGGPPTPSGKCS